MYKLGPTPLFAFFAIALLLAKFTSANTTTTPPCGTATDLTNYNYEKIVWSADKDNLACYVWRNIEYLKEENCRRQNRNEEVLHEISQDQCKCASVCTLEYAPVCAEYKNNEFLQFSNKCALYSHDCQNTKPYIRYDERECN